MKKILKLAGIPIEINTIYNSLPEVCEIYETSETPLFSVSITEQDIFNERQKSIEECAFEGIPYPNYSPCALESTAVYRKIADKLPDYDALVFHGSAVAVGEKAVLFTAKSGTGKTTHTKLWLKNIEGSYIVNGDKPIIRIIGGKIYVCGTPWMGKEGYGDNKTVPLSAICILNRAEQNSIREIGFSSALGSLLGACYRPPESMAMIKTAKLVEKIGQGVKLCELFCNMQDEAARISYEGMLL